MTWTLLDDDLFNERQLINLELFLPAMKTGSTLESRRQSGELNMWDDESYSISFDEYSWRHHHYFFAVIIATRFFIVHFVMNFWICNFLSLVLLCSNFLLKRCMQQKLWPLLTNLMWWAALPPTLLLHCRKNVQNLDVLQRLWLLFPTWFVSIYLSSNAVCSSRWALFHACTVEYFLDSKIVVKIGLET